jgi:hypothetical protein
MGLIAILVGTAGCSQKPAKDSQPPISIPPRLWEQFSGEKAFEEVARQVAFGPRPSGSAALETARGHIAGTLKGHGWDVERQEFDATPVPGHGGNRFVNIIARFAANDARPAPRDAQRAIVASHYDTKRMTGVHFVGANDGGSSTGALLELARVLAAAPALAAQIELVFFDGEEAVQQFGSAEEGPDGLVGSRHYARVLRETSRATQFRFAIVWDMIGDKDLTVTLPRDTPAALASGLFAASEQLGVRKHFGYYPERILDDHEPLIRIARIPAMDIIDFDYPPWHTSGDTLEKLSPASLEIVGRATLVLLIRELAPAPPP